MKIGIHSLKISLFVLAANCAALTWADIVMTGSGDYSYKISADASLAGQKMIVDSNASVLKYPGIFAPNSGEKKKVFRNVKLSDIVSFKARIGTQDNVKEPWSWIESTMFHDSGDSQLVSGERTCQLQVLRNTSHIIGFSLKFEQDGNDVNCFIEYAKYAYKQDGQFFWL